MDEEVNPLERDHSLSVVLPGGLEKNATVHGSKPVMDLLVTLCASYHLNPSDYTVEVLSPNKNNIRFKPNSPIGSLEAEKIVLKPRGVEEKIKRPYMPEATVRLLINYNKAHKAVVRVNPRVPLELLLPLVCGKCEFEVDTTVLLRDAQSKELLDLNKSLNEHGLREVFAKDSGKEPADHRHQLETPEADAISPPSLQDLQKKEPRQKENPGFLSLFRRKKKNPELDGAASAPASPGANKSMALSTNVQDASFSDTADTPKKRRAPQPPMGASLSVPNNLNACHLRAPQTSADSTLRRTKRRAPPPPCANSHQEQQLTGPVDPLDTLEELRESDDLSLPSSSSTRTLPSSSSSRLSFDPHLPSFRGKDFLDTRLAFAKVLTSSVSKGTVVKHWRNSATLPKFHGRSSFLTRRFPDKSVFRIELDSVLKSRLPTEPEWEDPLQRKGMTTFKVVPLNKQESHEPLEAPDQGQVTVENDPESEAPPEESDTLDSPRDSPPPAQVPPDAPDSPPPAQVPPDAPDSPPPAQVPPDAPDSPPPAQVPPDAPDSPPPAQVPPDAPDSPPPAQEPSDAPDSPPPAQDLPDAPDSPPPTQEPSDAPDSPPPAQVPPDAPDSPPPAQLPPDSPDSPPPAQDPPDAPDSPPPAQEPSDAPDSPPPAQDLPDAPDSPPPTQEPSDAPDSPPPAQEPSDAPDSPPPAQEPSDAPDSPPPAQEPSDAPDSPPPAQEPSDAPDSPPPTQEPPDSPPPAQEPSDAPDSPPPAQDPPDAPDSPPPAQDPPDAPDSPPPAQDPPDAPDSSPPAQDPPDAPDSPPPAQEPSDAPDSPLPPPDPGDQGRTVSPLSEVKGTDEELKEDEEEEPEVISEVTTAAESGNLTSDDPINADDEDLQSPGRQSVSLDVDPWGSCTDESEYEEVFPPPPPPVFFNEVLEEEREDATTSPSHPPSPFCNGETNVVSDSDAPQPSDKMSPAPSRFAQAVALAVQKSHLQSHSRDPSGRQSEHPPAPRSTYQYGA